MRMSNLDILSRDFWKDNKRFADLFNTVLYDGKQVILPEKLMEADSNLSGSIQTKKKEDVFVERRADLIRKFAGDSEYAIFLLENQSHIHYGMPLRVMMYDALGYREEEKTKRMQFMQTGMNSCQECEKKRESILYLLWWYTMEKNHGMDQED